MLLVLTKERGILICALSRTFFLNVFMLNTLGALLYCIKLMLIIPEGITDSVGYSQFTGGPVPDGNNVLLKPK